MSTSVITSAKVVRDMVKQGFELWHVSRDALPGCWELRRDAETHAVSWDAIEGIRRHYTDWFVHETEEIQQGRFTWIYRLKQRPLALRGGVS